MAVVSTVLLFRALVFKIAWLNLIADLTVPSYTHSLHIFLALSQVFRVMTLRHVQMDEVIIKEGDKGDEMYIVER